MWSALYPEEDEMPARAMQVGQAQGQANPQRQAAPAPSQRAPQPQAVPPQAHPGASPPQGQANGGGPASGGAAADLPEHIRQNVDPNNQFQMELIARLEHFTPQDVQAFAANIAPPAVAVLKKLLPEIGFLIDRAVQVGQAQGQGAPVPPPPGPVPQPQAAPAPQAAPPRAASGLRSV